MRKRIAVARGIITLPKIIFFDELDICKIILNASHPRLINALIKKKEALESEAANTDLTDTSAQPQTENLQIAN